MLAHATSYIGKAIFISGSLKTFYCYRLEETMLVEHKSCYILGHDYCLPFMGRNEVRRRPGQDASLAPPCSNQSFLGSKFTVLKKVLMTFLGLFRPPQWFGAPYCLGGRGIVPLLPPLVTPLLPLFWTVSHMLRHRLLVLI